MEASSAPGSTEGRSHVEWQVVDGHHRLRVEGDFDQLLSGAVGSLLESIAQSNPRSVTMFADRLTLFGSWGLRALERGTEALARCGVRLTIVGASNNMRAVLEHFVGGTAPIVFEPAATN